MYRYYQTYLVNHKQMQGYGQFLMKGKQVSNSKERGHEDLLLLNNKRDQVNSILGVHEYAGTKERRKNKMHFIQTIGLITVMLISFIPALAYDFEVDGIYYNILSEEEKTCEVTYNDDKEYTGDVIIPAQVRYNNITFDVTSIGIDAFEYCESLISVVLPNSVTCIEEHAFHDCISLQSIVMPKFLKRIGDSAFSGCESLVSIEIPNSVTSIEEDAFIGCHSLKSIVIPNSVTSIETDTFYDCYSLQSIVIPNSVTRIGEDCFVRCYSLQSIVIPNSVTYIGHTAFRECTKLKEVKLSDNLEIIRYATFEDCSSLESLTIPGAVKTIEQAWNSSNRTFDNCEALKFIKFEYNNSTLQFGINHEVFEEDVFEETDIFDWTNTLEVLYIDRHLSARITYLESLKELQIGMHINELQVDLLQAANLTKIITYAQVPPSGLSCTDEQYKNVTVTVPKGTLEAYQTAEGWKNFWNIVEDSGIAAESLELNHVNVELNIDDSIQLEVTVVPETTSDKTIDWSSSSPEIASVTEGGLVTAKAIGSAVITATCGNVSAQCVITVNDKSGVDDVLINSDSQFDVYNLHGMKIKSSCNIDDIQNLPHGIYIISANNRRVKISI